MISGSVSYLKVETMIIRNQLVQNADWYDFDGFHEVQ